MSFTKAPHLRGFFFGGKMKFVSASNEVHPFYLNPTSFMDADVDVEGIVMRVKSMGKMNFFLLETIGGIFQCIENKQREIVQGASLRVKAKVQAAKIRDILITHRELELFVLEMNELSRPSEAMPFDISKPDLNVNNDVLFDLRPLTLRHPKEKAVFTIQNFLVHGLRQAFMKRLCREIRTPKIVQEGAEGGANIFSLEYFGRMAYLTQSPQFYKEFGVGIFQRVFEIAPVFRAEKHNTSRHLNEYISIDVEIGPINSFYEIMNFEMSCLKEAIDCIKQNCTYELELLGCTLPVIGEVPVLKFSEAKEVFFQGTGIDERNEMDLSPQEEKFLSQWALEKHQSEFLFVTHYPSAKRPFYAMDSLENENETNSFDLLFRGVEITTGGQRIHQEEQIIEKMKKRGMNYESFEFFTKAHRYGLPPHGGFGLGLERLTQKILNLESVKLTTMYPRDITRISP